MNDKIISHQAQRIVDRFGGARRLARYYSDFTGEELAPPLVAEVRRALLAHLQDHYALYGEFTGVRSARKHIGWYVRGLPGGAEFRADMNTIEDSAAQLAAVQAFFDALAARQDRLPVAAVASGELQESDA